MSIMPSMMMTTIGQYITLLSLSRSSISLCRQLLLVVLLLLLYTPLLLSLSSLSVVDSFVIRHGGDVGGRGTASTSTSTSIYYTGYDLQRGSSSSKSSSILRPSSFFTTRRSGNINSNSKINNSNSNSMSLKTDGSGGFQTERPTSPIATTTTKPTKKKKKSATDVNVKQKPKPFTRKQNHPNSYKENPSFKGPLILPRSTSTSDSKKRISYYWYRNNISTMDNNDKTTTTTTTTIYTEEGEEKEEDEQQLQQQQQLEKENIQEEEYTHTPLRWLQLQYLSSQVLLEPPKPLSPNSTTQTILKRILEQLIYKDAPIDAKEVAESMEFYLRTYKRLLGRAKRKKSNRKNTKTNTSTKEQQQIATTTTTTIITVYDMCSGHGFTGMLFAACNPPRKQVVGEVENSSIINVVLVDQTEPPAHRILKECILEICPWIETMEHNDADDNDNHNDNHRKNKIQFVTATVEEFTASCRREKDENNNNNNINNDDNDNDNDNDNLDCLSFSSSSSAAASSSASAEIVIATHACGSLTDSVIEFCTSSTNIATATTGQEQEQEQEQEQGISISTRREGGKSEGVSALALMPCCYTGTDSSHGSGTDDNVVVVPFGVRRVLGVSMSADIRRSFVLQDAGYHVDFATIPSEITPMNRIIVGENIHH